MRSSVRQVVRIETYLVTTQTPPGGEEARRAQAVAYTTYLERNIDCIVLGAQVLDRPDGTVAQRLYFIRATNADAARLLIDQSPYRLSGVYEIGNVRPATGMLGELVSGVVWTPRTAAR